MTVCDNHIVPCPQPCAGCEADCDPEHLRSEAEEPEPECANCGEFYPPEDGTQSVWLDGDVCPPCANAFGLLGTGGRDD